MHWSSWVLSAVALLSDTASAKAIALPSLVSRRSNGYEAAMLRGVSPYQSLVDRRSASGVEAIAVGSGDGTVNSTVAIACAASLSTMTSVNNSAGYAGCYNILEWDPKTAMFQADLRIYQQSTATGDFADIPANQVNVLLTFPETTQTKSLVKRRSLDMKRDNSSAQIQQYTLAGNFKSSYDMTKLNSTLLLSLMVPQITLRGIEPGTTNMVSTNMTVSDMAWFVAGQIVESSAQAAQAANPATAAAAVTAASPFVIPGRTFGIFPTGLIVTSSWTVLFFIAFGLGTIGRVKSRSVYRKRINGLAARGKR